MIRCVKYICCVIGGFLACFLVAPGPLESFYSLSLRDNGKLWFECGPALITASNCNCIFVRLGHRGLVVTNKKQIDQIKNWISQTNISTQVTYSPLWPTHDYKATIPSYSLDLFSSSSYTDNNYRIIFIPLLPLTLGVSKDIYDVKMKQLTELIDKSQMEQKETGVTNDSK